MRSCLYCLLIVYLHFLPQASSQLTGKIFRKGSTEVLSGVNVKNSTTKKYNTSDLGGNYIVPAQPGDTVIFSSAGKNVFKTYQTTLTRFDHRPTELFFQT